MKWLKRLGISVGLGLLLVVGLVAFRAALPASTPPIAGDGAVSGLERVEIGGVEQTILVRGRDVSRPVLLYVHGGPGGAHLPLARMYSAALEDAFVVVHWDQRGAGASCDGVDRGTLSLDRIVTDAIELSEHLASRFGGDGKIVLLGHSWGSVVGVLAAQKRPDLFHAYIGLGQLVHGGRNEELSYDWVVSEATRRGDHEALAELRDISPPYADNAELGVQRGWLNRYNGSFYTTDQILPALRELLFAREYSLGTWLSYPGCAVESLEALWVEVGDIDFPNQVPRLEVPVYFFTGRHDWNTPFPLVEEWATTLEAPSIEIVWFEDAGHMIPIEAPKAFQRAVLDKVLPHTPGHRSDSAGATSRP